MSLGLGSQDWLDLSTMGHNLEYGISLLWRQHRNKRALIVWNHTPSISSDQDKMKWRSLIQSWSQSKNLLLGMTLGKSKYPYNSGMWIAPPFPLLCLCVIFHEPGPSGTASTMSSFHQFPKPYLYFIFICCLEDRANTEKTQAVDNYCFPWLMCRFTEGWKEGRKGRKNKKRERKLDNLGRCLYIALTTIKWLLENDLSYAKPHGMAHHLCFLLPSPPMFFLLC